MKPLTALQTMELLLVETKNQLTKCQILERLYFRLNLKGGKYLLQQGENQTAIRRFEATLENLEAIHQDMLEQEKEKSATM